MCDEGSGKWVLIVDNADDSGVFFSLNGERAVIGGGTRGETQERSLSTFLPNTTNGTIIITTRDRDTAFRFTGRHQDIIQVGPMGHEDALTLLEKKLGDYHERDGGAELVRRLDYIPLAITQASAYIYRRAPRTSITKYLKEIQKSKWSQASP